MADQPDNWFTKLCRRAGLAVHHAARPAKRQKTEVSRRVEQKRLNDRVTLRRTTIEEVEIEPGDEADAEHKQT
jgi:hypothetical protein